MVKEYQWNMFWVNLDPAKGSEQSGTRPVLVVSTEPVNRALPVVTVLSITSMKPGRKIYPTEIRLPQRESGLDMDSIAMAHQIRSISKERLGTVCGKVNNPELREQIHKTIMLYLGIS